MVTCIYDRRSFLILFCVYHRSLLLSIMMGSSQAVPSKYNHVYRRRSLLPHINSYETHTAPCICAYISTAYHSKYPTTVRDLSNQPCHTDSFLSNSCPLLVPQLKYLARHLAVSMHDHGSTTHIPPSQGSTVGFHCGQLLYLYLRCVCQSRYGLRNVFKIYQLRTEAPPDEWL